MRSVRPPQAAGQHWATFLHNHAAHIWACDFLQVTDLFFRPLFAFFLTLLKSRKVIHVGVTRSPTDTWIGQQLREATPYGQAPKYLLCDHDGKFGSRFAHVAATTNFKLLRTPYQAPRANAICERFLGSVRRECLDHFLILHEKQHEPRAQWLCSVLQSSTTTGSASYSNCQSHHRLLLHPITQMTGSSGFPSWAAYTMTLEEQHEGSQTGLERRGEGSS
jgi:hypothetical protein